MPPKNFRNLTVRREAYDLLMEDYKATPKKWLVQHGISSFSGYVTYRLNELAEETLKRKSQQNQNQPTQPPP
ncbi:MAG: hypothetical protein M1490_03245 [Candidatus Bathyarchaeota archaeon]|nr:hypothetical protein [Candidatus Bathyarchaeota archaeon]